MAFIKKKPLHPPVKGKMAGAPKFQSPPDYKKIVQKSKSVQPKKKEK